MKRWVILTWIGVVGLASIIIGGCSSVSINPLWSSNQVLPQAKTNAVTIDFHAINLDDFPVEQEILRQESKELLEIIYRKRFGRPVKVESLDLSFPGNPLPPPSSMFDILFGDQIPPFKDQESKMNKALDAIIAQAKNNKEKYLVASVHANPIDPVKLCYSFERVYKSGKAFYIDLDKALRNKVRAILKSCSWR